MQSIEQVTRDECLALLNIRGLHEELNTLKDGLRELRLLSISVSSPKQDGMPKQQSAQGDAYAQTLTRIEKQEQEIARMERRIRTARRTAQHALKAMHGAAKVFCAAYYVGGEPFEIARAASGVGRSRCYEFAAAVKAKAGKQE